MPVTQKWLIGVFTSIILMGGAGWLTFVQSQIRAVQADQKAAEGKAAQQSEDTAVIREQVQELRNGQKRQEENQKEMDRKLDELLRRR